MNFLENGQAICYNISVYRTDISILETWKLEKENEV